MSAHDLEASTCSICPFVTLLINISLHWVYYIFVVVYEPFSFWMVELKGYKWKNQAYFVKQEIFLCCWYVCFCWIASSWYTIQVIELITLIILHWACLILLIIVYATKLWMLREEIEIWSYVVLKYGDLKFFFFTLKSIAIYSNNRKGSANSF